jgi:hypothetical protein
MAELEFIPFSLSRKKDEQRERERERERENKAFLPFFPPPFLSFLLTVMIRLFANVTRHARLAFFTGKGEQVRRRLLQLAQGHTSAFLLFVTQPRPSAQKRSL